MRRQPSVGRPTRLAVALAPALALLLLGWSRRWICEDAFIDLRVVENLLAGSGPVYNLGERVEVYTNPLWVGLLAGIGGPLRALAGVPLEWTAVGLGLALGCSALLAGVLGSAAARGQPLGARSLPIGALVLLALPPFWDFATSGLEGSLALCWLALCYLELALRHERRAAFLLGLGPLIRPELALFSAAWFVAQQWIGRAPAREVLLRAALAAVVPLAYQTFRMGFFGAALPNTALAKEAALAHWGQGLIYARDFVVPYRLWIPAAVGAALGIRALRGGARGPGVLALATVLAALAHLIFVVRVGGDFMHARLLLPTLFALLIPVMTVATGDRLQLAGAALIAVWAVACALAMRVDYEAYNRARGLLDQRAFVGPELIADERAFHVRFSGHPHPVTLHDYRTTPWAKRGERARRLAARERVLLLDSGAVPLRPGVRADVVIVRANIGLSGYAAGPRVHVVDRLGLGDAIASRLRIERRGRPGHEKRLGDAWVGGRFTAARTPAWDAARGALGCGDLAVLLRAIEQPLTPGRFLENVAGAPRLTRLRVAADPAAARAELCSASASSRLEIRERRSAG